VITNSIFKVCLVAVAICSFSVLFNAASDPPQAIEIQSGNTSFQTITNVPGLEVAGKSSAVSGRVLVSRNDSGLLLQQIEASVPVKSLATGISLRDEHMRKYIFTTSDGQLPDLEFKANEASCVPVATTQEFTCHVSGELSIRGVMKPLSVSLRAKQQGGAPLSFRAAGDALVKLSDYGITPPSQFGVRPANEVRVHLEFNGKESRQVTASTGEAR